MPAAFFWFLAVSVARSTIWQVADLNPTKVVRQEALVEKGTVDAVSGVAFTYDIYTNPSKNNGLLGTTLTKEATTAIHGRWDFYNHE